MSSYLAETKHPDTGEWQHAEWIDNYYGHRKYGVRFPDGRMFSGEKFKKEDVK